MEQIYYDRKRKELTERVDDIENRIKKAREEKLQKEKEEAERLAKKAEEEKQRQKLIAIQKGKKYGMEWVQNILIPDQEKLTKNYEQKLISIPDTHCVYRDWNGAPDDPIRMEYIKQIKQTVEELTNRRVIYGFADQCDKDDPCYRPPNPGTDIKKDPERPTCLKIDLENKLDSRKQ